jgi:hypothetical protein
MLKDSPTVHNSSHSAVPTAPLDSPEKVISLLCFLRANHNVSLAEFNLLDCEINWSATHIQYYTQQAENVRKCVECAEHTIRYGRMVITREWVLV